MQCPHIYCMDLKEICESYCVTDDFNGLMQKMCNSIANILDLHIVYIQPSHFSL